MRQWVGSALVQIIACRLFGAKPLSKQICDIVNWTLRNKLQWNFYSNTNIFIHENASENIVCEMPAILSRGKCVYSYPPGQWRPKVPCLKQRWPSLFAHICVGRPQWEISFPPCSTHFTPSRPSWLTDITHPDITQLDNAHPDNPHPDITHLGHYPPGHYLPMLTNLK